MTNEKTPEDIREKIREIAEEWKNAKLEVRARKQWVDWMCAYDWSVMGVLKYRDLSNNKWKEQKASGESAQQALRHYWKKIDEIFFGSRARRHNERLMRSVVKHLGVGRRNTHYHFVAYHPYYSAESLSETLQEVWERTIFHSDNSGRFEPVKNTTALLNYMTGEWNLLEQDTFEVFELNLDDKHRFGYHNSESNRNDIRNRRQKVGRLTDSR